MYIIVDQLLHYQVKQVLLQEYRGELPQEHHAVGKIHVFIHFFYFEYTINDHQSVDHR